MAEMVADPTEAALRSPLDPVAFDTVATLLAEESQVAKFVMTRVVESL
jgi:hypothetical protein